MIGAKMVVANLLRGYSNSDVVQATTVSQQHLLLLLLQSQRGQQPALPKKGLIWAQPSCLTTMCQLTWHQWERRGAELMSVWRYENLTQLPSEALLI